MDQIAAGAILAISIHAPAGGATVVLRPFPLKRPISIHAPAGGATRYHNSHEIATMHFNPRSRGGSDFLCKGIVIIPRNISIHAPAGGATLGDFLCIIPKDWISIHAPAGGATQSSGNDPAGRNFNPRSRGGSDSKRT